MVAGGGGTLAQMLFAEKNIHFILGVTGKIDEVIDKLCQGELEGGRASAQEMFMVTGIILVNVTGETQI